MDILNDVIYPALTDNSKIVEIAGNRIKYYEYPETGDVSSTWIVIDPLDSPKPSDYGDNRWLTYDYLLQIDVWGKDRHEVRNVSELVLLELWKVGFHHDGTGVDEYDEDTQIFRLARRYRGKKYIEENE